LNGAGAADEVQIEAATSGMYQIEVEGWTDATYQLSVEISDSCLEAGSARLTASGKQPRTRPAANPDSEPADQAAVSMAPSLRIGLPLIIRMHD
jgi:hypothetical protein